ncbi:MAG TPA: hypothetical protein VGB55_04105 [Tepidisphaeraceae bacterium]|jgi:hypothetical protein
MSLFACFGGLIAAVGGCANERLGTACGWVSVPVEVTVLDANTRVPLREAVITSSHQIVAEGVAPDAKFHTDTNGRSTVYLLGGYSQSDYRFGSISTYTWGGQWIYAKLSGYRDGAIQVPEGRSDRRTWTKERPLRIQVLLASAIEAAD